MQVHQPITAGELHPTSSVFFLLARIGCYVTFLLCEGSQSESNMGSSEKKRTKSAKVITVSEGSYLEQQH